MSKVKLATWQYCILDTICLELQKRLLTIDDRNKLEVLKERFYSGCVNKRIVFSEFWK